MEFVFYVVYPASRQDLGFKVICEQVSHHPPISAFHAESDLYTFNGSIYPKIKFWGKSVEVTPKGLVTLYLKKLVLQILDVASLLFYIEECHP